MLNLMIAEDDVAIGSSYLKFLTKDKDIKIVSYTTDGEETLKEYLEKRPDVLILDLDMPKMNGLEILKHLNTLPDEKNKCNVIIISGDKQKIANLHRIPKVYDIITKPIEYGELPNLVKEIAIPNNFENKKNILFKNLKFKPYSTGTTYLSDAVDIAHRNNSILNNISVLYKILSQKHNVSASKVKWTIRYTIKQMNKDVPEDYLKSIFYIYEKNEDITPKCFLTYATEYLEKVSV